MNNTGLGNSGTGLKIGQPFNLTVFLTFFSPIIVAIIILSMSFIFQNFKGFGYLIWLIVFSWLRNFGYELTGAKPYEQKGDLCTMIEYSKYANSGFSIFFIAFSLVYVCAPMFVNKEINYWILSPFLFYLFLDISMRYSMKCITQVTDILLNLLIGLSCGISAIITMYTVNLSNCLFFNETSSTKDICSMPTKQTFRCNVYKGGELIGSTNT